jgi:hypothetical protein
LLKLLIFWKEDSSKNLEENQSQAIQGIFSLLIGAALVAFCNNLQFHFCLGYVEGFRIALVQMEVMSPYRLIQVLLGSL